MSFIFDLDWLREERKIAVWAGSPREVELLNELILARKRVLEIRHELCRERAGKAFELSS
jgi:hypothetical protein